MKYDNIKQVVISKKQFKISQVIEYISLSIDMLVLSGFIVMECLHQGIPQSIQTKWI